MLGDHYDPIHKRVVLSRENFYGTSVAALGVAAHECGHAIQHKYAYAPLQWRMASVGLTTFANQIVLWLPLLGMFIGFLNTGMALILMASAWGILMLFNLLTPRRIRRLGASAPSAAADRLDTDGGRRDGARECIKCSSLDLCCRVHYVARLLFAARVASARGTQRVIRALPQNIQKKGLRNYETQNKITFNRLLVRTDRPPHSSGRSPKVSGGVSSRHPVCDSVSARFFAANAA